MISNNYLLNMHEAAVKPVKQIRNTHKYKIQKKNRQQTVQLKKKTANLTWSIEICSVHMIQ